MVRISESTNHGFSVIFLAGFVVIFAIALVAQPLQLHWRTWFPGAEGNKSIIHAVRDSVYSFMSHLT